MCHAPAALLYYSTAVVQYCYDTVLEHGFNSFGSVMHALAAALSTHAGLQSCMQNNCIFCREADCLISSYANDAMLSPLVTNQTCAISESCSKTAAGQTG